MSLIESPEELNDKVGGKMEHSVQLAKSDSFNCDLFIQEHPRNLIPELLRLFYQLDWVTGTGGGISIKRK